jgi:hypothetical protein
MAVEAQDWDGGAGSAGGQRRPGWAAWAEEAKQAGWAKIGFLNVPWLCKFIQGDLGGILMWGFLLNSSRLLKDFRKI